MDREIQVVERQIFSERVDRRGVGLVGGRRGEAFRPRIKSASPDGVFCIVARVSFGRCCHAPMQLIWRSRNCRPPLAHCLVSVNALLFRGKGHYNIGGPIMLSKEKAVQFPLSALFLKKQGG